MIQLSAGAWSRGTASRRPAERTWDFSCSIPCTKNGNLDTLVSELRSASDSNMTVVQVGTLVHSILVTRSSLPRIKSPQFVQKARSTSTFTFMLHCVTSSLVCLCFQLRNGFLLCAFTYELRGLDASFRSDVEAVTILAAIWQQSPGSTV